MEAALRAAEQVDRAAAERRRAVERELEEAQYEASLAARRHELVDPAKRHVARELEARWNTALERVGKSSNALSGWTPSGRLIRGVECADDQYRDEAAIDPHADRGSHYRPGRRGQ